jgi:predicted AlkP superfamily phosphohydrolase/phosphomutase
MTSPPAHKVLAIGLDGYEESLERQWIDAGELPAIAELRRNSARYLLDHGPAQRTGLAWEHVSTGLSPERAKRWAAVHFDPATYAVWQEGTRLHPFAAQLKSRTVVFDAPYFDLDRAPQVRGLVGWGAHDPGVPISANPPDLLSEFSSRFGEYPAKDWIYGHVWASVKRTQAMGAGLAQAVELRARAASWLLSERLPEWDLAIVVVSEPHSAIEGLWHGIDENHPLHRLPSAGPARDGLLAVYRAVDHLVQKLANSFPDATLVIFSMGGMGPNRSDVASMVLLPELMYREAFGQPLLRQPDEWSSISGTGPQLGEQEGWGEAINVNILPAERYRSARRLASRLLPESVKCALRPRPRHRACVAKEPLRPSLEWMPAALYRPYWHRMPAFALPSFYDGRIRINLAGRERSGMISRSQYSRVCDDIAATLRRCRDPITGAEVVDDIERIQDKDPLVLGPTESDLVVVWQGTACAFDHPELGRFGPVPFRRPGGHTGKFGMAYIHNTGISAGDRGVRSSFDVVPTLVELLDEPLPSGLSGASLLAEAPAR